MRRALLAACLLACAARANAGPLDVHSELAVDLYYTSLRTYLSRADKPRQYLGRKDDELGVYKALLKRSFVPRDLVLEASVNPMPLLGTVVREHAPGLYGSAKVTKNLNLVRAVTHGFEEPWALSMFAGDVMESKTLRRGFVEGDLAYSGYLASVGNFHILDNQLVPDDWVKTEWKLKGDRILKDQTLRWSFRTGARFNANHEVSDTVYVSFRRSRIDYHPAASRFWFNSGFQYQADLSQRDGSPLRHTVSVDKKFPLGSRRLALSTALGFVWTARGRYRGTLAARVSDEPQFQVVLRPTLQF